MKKTNGEFGGYPIQIAHLVENYSKRTTDALAERFSFKDPRRFYSMLRFLFAAVAGPTGGRCLRLIDGGFIEVYQFRQ